MVRFLHACIYVLMYLCLSVCLHVCIHMYDIVGVDIKNTFAPSYKSDLTSSNKVTNVLAMRSLYYMLYNIGELQ